MCIVRVFRSLLTRRLLGNTRKIQHTVCSCACWCVSVFRSLLTRRLLGHTCRAHFLYSLFGRSMNCPRASCETSEPDIISLC